MNTMHPHDRIAHARELSEGLSEIALALMESPDYCESALAVVYEVARTIGGELGEAHEALRFGGNQAERGAA